MKLHEIQLTWSCMRAERYCTASCLGCCVLPAENTKEDALWDRRTVPRRRRAATGKEGDVPLPACVLRGPQKTAPLDPRVGIERTPFTKNRQAVVSGT